jgi:hypothetical protein
MDCCSLDPVFFLQARHPQLLCSDGTLTPTASNRAAVDRLGLVYVVVLLLQLATLLSVHPGLDLLQLALTSQELLSLFVDLTLHLDLNFTQLLLLASQLLLLQADRLAGEVLRVHRRVTTLVLVCACLEGREGNIRISTTLDALAELLGTVVLVQEVMRNFLEIGKMAVEKRAAYGKEV